MKAVLAFMGVLAIAGCAMEGKKSGTHQTAAKPAKAKPAPKPTLDDIAFSVAHAGAGPVNPANVYNNLFPINAGNSELIWRDPAKKQVLKVISVMSLKAYNSYYKGQKTTTSVIAGPHRRSAVETLLPGNRIEGCQSDRPDQGMARPGAGQGL